MGKIIKIREVGDPVLYQEVEQIAIEKISKEILDIIEDLKTTLQDSGGFGIAAPQIGISKAIAVIRVEKEKCTYKNAEEVPITVMINPTWKPLSEEKEVEYEGCLSVPTIRGLVERFTKIEATYYNEQGEKIVKQVEGFTSRDIQHECDHLAGVIFLDRVIPQGFTTKDMLNKYCAK